MRRCYGIQDVIIGHYDERLMKTPWREFVTDYLVRDNNAVHLVAGHDFHFGYKGEGNPQRLQALCAELGLGCDIVAKVEEDGVTVSSTYIRTLIAQGEMARAVQFLGHPHVLSGVVRHGKRLGTTLGFPTVNLTLPAGVIVPAHGVYAARLVLADGSSHPAVTNVGIRPTLDDGNAVTVESYLLHFDGDLYEQEVRVEFYTYLRPERKFDTLEELRAEVMKNACQAEEFFQTQPL
jgi:riboflavin kinase/FMN adenylyltransferase